MGYELTIAKEVHDKVMHWVRKSNNEVSGFGKVVREGTSFRVISAHLLEQEVGSAHTDIDDKALSKLMFESKDEEGELTWWWHSHVDMSVFWSAQDRETIQELAKHGWIVASVFNKSEEVRSALCYKYEYSSEFGKGESVALYDDIATVIELDVDDTEVARWDEEYKAKVREKSSIITMGRSWEDYEYNPATGVTRHKREQAATPATKEPDFDRDPGLLGYGVKVEAEALGMSVVQYYNKLNSKNMAEIYKLEDRIERLEREGKIKGVPYAY